MKKATHSIAVMLLLGVFLLPHQLHAFSGGILGCGAASAGALASVTAFVAVAEVPVVDAGTRAATQTQTTKECILDGLVVAIREALIATITQNIVDWINSGFEGGPAFVTDLSAFLGEVADNTAIDFIQGTELGRLCTPFQATVRIYLQSQYQRQKDFGQRAQCTVGDILDNVDRMLAGDFIGGGGWPTWFRMHLSPQNTPSGALVLAQLELNNRVVGAQNEELKLLEFGDGFFSKKRCVRWNATRIPATGNAEGGAGGEQLECIDWEITTPGTQINNQLSTVLGSGFRQLELADEIDEIISALLAQLGQQIFTALNGLQGLSSSSSGGPSYLDRLTEETLGGSFTRAKDALTTDIEGALSLGIRYQQEVEAIIIAYRGAEAGFQNIFTCSTAAGNTAIAATASTTLATAIRPLIADYENQKNQAEQTIAELEEILEAAQTAETIEALNAAAARYDALLSLGVVRTSTDIAAIILERTAQTGVIDGYTLEINTAIASCGS